MDGKGKVLCVPLGIRIHRTTGKDKSFDEGGGEGSALLFLPIERAA